MLNSYFFVPAGKKKFIEKTSTLRGCFSRVFDLEDSTMPKDEDLAFNNLERVFLKETDWLRVSSYRLSSAEYLAKLQNLRIRRFILPKIEDINHFQIAIELISGIGVDMRIILLIENAKVYLQLEKILDIYSTLIDGISLGIHDFSSTTGILNDYRVLSNVRQNILLIASAYSIEPIDVVSMTLDNQKEFSDEVKDGFRLGYRSKFIINPKQLEAIEKIAFYSEEEVGYYLDLLKHYENEARDKEAVFRFRGKAYEKMHLKEIERIVKWGKSFFNANREIL